jgi:hypothetical protein
MITTTADNVPTVPLLPARLAVNTGNRYRDECVVVTDLEHDVRVRWAYRRPVPWRCSECGPMTAAECAHTFAAGVLLAEHLLGLTRSVHLKETNP